MPSNFTLGKEEEKKRGKGSIKNLSHYCAVTHRLSSDFFFYF